jgi:hypothetical protein
MASAAGAGARRACELRFQVASCFGGSSACCSRAPAASGSAGAALCGDLTYEAPTVPLQERELDEAFARYGRVENVWVAYKPAGFAYVVRGFPTPRLGSAALVHPYTTHHSSINSSNGG